MLVNKQKIAVVEDNGLARANIRNHLLDMGFTEVACYGNGRELKNNIKNRHFDILLMDFHLDNHKNGVEVVQDLRHLKLLKHSTCVMFITADRMPLIIGQIVDIHPEALIIKPYTIRHFSRNILACFKLHHYLLPAYELMDDNDYDQALVVVDHLIKENSDRCKPSALIKLKARILSQLGRYSEACALYQGILEESNRVIWAKWGLIQNMYLDNRIDESQTLLHELTRSQLTTLRASEWLARICITSNQYCRAESYMQQIREGDLSISATRLKAYIYQALERGTDAISLLERKRESNRSVRERFDEITLDLARCYLFEAEEKPRSDRKNALNIAKVLIASVGRKYADTRLTVQKNYMNAVIAHLEGNDEKVKEILLKPDMDDLEEAEIPTLFYAINTNHIIGNTLRAKELLEFSQGKLSEIEEGNDKTISKILLLKNKEIISDNKPIAMEINKRGLKKYSARQFLSALEDFYKAYKLFPREIAFSLNVLQSLVEEEMDTFKELVTDEFLTELQARKLNNANKKRLDLIIQTLYKKRDVLSTRYIAMNINDEVGISSNNE